MVDREGVLQRNLWLNRKSRLPIKRVVAGSATQFVADSSFNTVQDEMGMDGGKQAKRGMYMTLKFASGSITVRSKVGLGHFKRQWAADSFVEGPSRSVTPQLSTMVTLHPDDFLRLQVWLEARGALRPRHPVPTL